MGILLEVQNAAFSNNAIRFIPPVAEGLEFWALFGSTNEKTKKNLAPNKPDGVLMGAPVISQGHATFSRYDYVETSVSDHADLTLFVVARVFDEETSGGGTLFSTGLAQPRPNGVGGSSSGVQFVYYSTVAEGQEELRAYRYRFNGVANSPTVAAPYPAQAVVTNQWALLAMVNDAATHTTRLRNLTTGQTTSAAAVAPNSIEDIVAATFKIGGQPGGASYAAPIDLAAAAMYHVALSDTDIALVYDRMKKTMALRGINI